MSTTEAYVVRHRRRNLGTRDVAYYDNAPDAIDRYDSLCKTFMRERVWVVDLMNDRIIADSHPKRR